ncbi:MAG: hypothetical protein IJ859_11120 [Synergistaceae bacterium]|nr:hypothetical protein [Synergistaceae bacterium]
MSDTNFSEQNPPKVEEHKSLLERIREHYISVMTVIGLVLLIAWLIDLGFWGILDLIFDILFD